MCFVQFVKISYGDFELFGSSTSIKDSDSAVHIGMCLNISNSNISFVPRVHKFTYSQI